MRSFLLPVVALSVLQLVAADPRVAAELGTYDALSDSISTRDDSVAADSFVQEEEDPYDEQNDPNTDVVPDDIDDDDDDLDAPEDDVVFSAEAAEKGAKALNFPAITYSPYKPGACKTQAEISSQMKKIHGHGYKSVRIYGVDCNQVHMVAKAAKARGIKVLAGVYNIGNVAQEAKVIAKAYKNGMHNIAAVSVGNEVVQNGQASPAQVVSAIKKARGIMRKAGFKGPVVTVDTSGAILNNPSLCKASDFAAPNIQAFFDGGIKAGGVGAFVKQQANRVHNVCKKAVVVTESGWPSKGQNNGAAVPSPKNQKAAISSLKKHFKSNLFYFTAFNDLWKDPGAFGVEQSFGILN